MNALLWLLRAALFVILLGLAIKNGGDVELRFYFDARWQAPLALVVLASLATGVLLGLLALLPRLVRQRREIGRLQRALDRQPAAAANVEPPVAS
jgi:uncharacterized integral membrane protein